MSGPEYKAIRERLEMTQALFAQAVGRSRKIINEREQADQVPVEAALAAELLALRATTKRSKGTNVTGELTPARKTATTQPIESNE